MPIPQSTVLPTDADADADANVDTDTTSAGQTWADNAHTGTIFRGRGCQAGVDWVPRCI